MQQNAPPNDFVKMQEQAIKRVREMQQKANPSQPKLQKENMQTQTKDMPRQDEQPKEGKLFEQEQKSNQEQPRKEEKPHYKEEKPHYNENAKQEGNHNPFANFLNSDADMSIILPLIFFLGKEGADDVLILALLYIMS